MDFDKIRPAVESIQLSEKQKEDILNACKGRKRKFNYKPLATVAAVIVVTLVFYGLNALFSAQKWLIPLKTRLYPTFIIPPMRI